MATLCRYWAGDGYVGIHHPVPSTSVCAWNDHLLRNATNSSSSNTWRYQSSRIKERQSLLALALKESALVAPENGPCSRHHQQSVAEHFLKPSLCLCHPMPCKRLSRAAARCFQQLFFRSSTDLPPWGQHVQSTAVQEGRCLSIHISPHFIWSWLSTNKRELSLNDKKAV